MQLLRWSRLGALCAIFSLVACNKGASDEEEWAAVAKSIPWVVQVLENCETYKGAAKDLDKARVFRMNQNMMKAASVDGVQGKIVRLQKNDKGDEYNLQVEVGERVKFATHSKTAPIKKGTVLWDALEGLKEGACVKMWAKEIEPLSRFQLAKVCNLDYYATFTELKRCP